MRLLHKVLRPVGAVNGGTAGLEHGLHRVGPGVRGGVFQRHESVASVRVPVGGDVERVGEVDVLVKPGLLAEAVVHVERRAVRRIFLRLRAGVEVPEALDALDGVSAVVDLLLGLPLLLPLVVAFDHRVVFRHFHAGGDLRSRGGQLGELLHADAHAGREGLFAGVLIVGVDLKDDVIALAAAAVGAHLRLVVDVNAGDVADLAVAEVAALGVHRDGGVVQLDGEGVLVHLHAAEITGILHGDRLHLRSVDVHEAERLDAADRRVCGNGVLVNAHRVRRVVPQYRAAEGFGEGADGEVGAVVHNERLGALVVCVLGLNGLAVERDLDVAIGELGVHNAGRRQYRDAQKRRDQYEQQDLAKLFHTDVLLFFPI